MCARCRRCLNEGTTRADWYLTRQVPVEGAGERGQRQVHPESAGRPRPRERFPPCAAPSAGLESSGGPRSRSRPAREPWRAARRRNRPPRPAGWPTSRRDPRTAATPPGWPAASTPSRDSCVTKMASRAAAKIAARRESDASARRAPNRPRISVPSRAEMMKTPRMGQPGGHVAVALASELLRGGAPEGDQVAQLVEGEGTQRQDRREASPMSRPHCRSHRSTTLLGGLCLGPGHLGGRGRRLGLRLRRGTARE